MSSYQGLLWPIRPKPLVGEVLSSWVSRTGAVADVSLQEFLRQRLPKKAGYRFDLDKIEQPDFYEALAAGAGVTVEEARATSYLSDEGLVYARRTFNNLEWIAPLSVAGRRGRHYSIPFCPSCLAEDSEPFYRKRWRYAFAPLCPKHGLLTNQCPHCHAPYAYRVGNRSGAVISSGSIGRCRYCGERFGRSVIPGLSDRTLDQVHGIQASVLQGLDDKWIDVPSRGPVHICMYLRGLHDLSVMALSPAQGKAMIDWFVAESGVDRPPRDTSQWMGAIESLSADNRAWLVMMSSWIVDEWPHRFVAMTKALRNGGGELSPSFVGLPGWMLHDDVQEIFARTTGRSPEEIEAATEILKRSRGWPASQAEVRAFMDTGHVPGVTPKSRPLSEEHKELFASSEMERARSRAAARAAHQADKDAPRELYAHIPFHVGEPTPEDEFYASESYQSFRQFLTFARREGSEEDDTI